MKEMDVVIDGKSIILVQPDFVDETINSQSEFNNEGFVESTGANDGLATNENSGYNWPKAAVELMLSLRRDYDDHFERPTCQKQKIWNQISDKMRQEGFEVKGVECNMKWRNLLITYRKNKEKLKKWGNTKVTWDFFHVMDELMAPKDEARSRSRSIVARRNDNLSSDYSSESWSSGQSRRRSKRRRKKSKPGKVEDKPPSWFLKFCRGIDGKDRAAAKHEQKQQQQHLDEEMVAAVVDATGEAANPPLPLPQPPVPPIKRLKKERKSELGLPEDEIAPAWFVRFCEERRIKEKAREEEEQRQWAEQKEIELQKLDAFNKLTAAIMEKLK